MVKHIQRGLTVIFILSVLATMVNLPFHNPISYAQDTPTEPIAYGGPGYIQEELMEALINASSNPDTFIYNPNGTSNNNEGGFAAFCNGELGFTMATRTIDGAEIINCETNGVEFIEVAFAGEALVFVPAVDKADVCLSLQDLPDILGTGYNPELNWTNISPFALSNPVTVYGPPTSSRDVSRLLNFLLTGGASAEVAYRTDYNQSDDPTAQLLELAAAEPADATAFVFMAFKDWDAIEDKGDLRPLEVTPDTPDNCVSPTGENVVTDQYAAGRSFFLYVNAAQVNDETAPLYNFLEFVLQDANGISKIGPEAGFTVAPPQVLERSWTNITEKRVGQTFTRTNLPFTVNPATPGIINITGSGLPYYRLQEVYESYNNEYFSVEVKINPSSDTDSWQAFCAGVVGVIQVTRPPTSEELNLCITNGIVNAEGTNLNSVLLGTEAVVFVVKGDSQLPVCLNKDQLTQLLIDTKTDRNSNRFETPATVDESSFVPPTTTDGIVLAQDGGDGDNGQNGEGEDIPLYDPNALQGPDNWSALGEDFPDLPLRVLVPPLGALETDLLLGQIGATQELLRTDAPIVQGSPLALAARDNPTLINNFERQGYMSDVDYRIASAAVLDGVITYAFWSEVQNREDNIRLVELNLTDSGKCIEPTLESILSTDENERYSLAFSTYLYYSDTALTDGFTAALIWHLYSQATLDQLAETNVIGFDATALSTSREDLFIKISELQATVTTPPPSDIPPTVAPTTEPTAEPTLEPTSAPTAEPTSAPTVEPTEESTVAPTRLPTREPTEAPTEIATETATPIFGG